MKPCRNTFASTVLKVLENRLYRTFGMLHKIMKDEGSSFKSNATTKHMEECAIEPDNVAPGNHRANSIAERTIQEVNGRISTTSPKEWIKWQKHLKDIDQAIRTKPVSLTPSTSRNSIQKTTPNSY